MILFLLARAANVSAATTNQTAMTMCEGAVAQRADAAERREQVARLAAAAGARVILIARTPISGSRPAIPAIATARVGCSSMRGWTT